MGVERIRAAWRQFPPARALRESAALGAKWLLDRYSTPSFAAAGEDLAVSALLGWLGGATDSGFYVDVGANDPVKNSNTYALYRRGWRGVTVDLNAEMVERHRATRPRDKAVWAAVSDEEPGTATAVEFDFASREYVDPDAARASVDRRYIAAFEGHLPVKREWKVPRMTLTAILKREGAPERFDLLSVDCEGHDLAVLRSLDFARYRPRLALVEIAGDSLSGVPVREALSHPVSELLANRGYEMVGYLALNAYYVDRR